MILNKNGQAVTELAILGALIIVAFSFLINYSEKINRQQANLHDTFRLALAEAKKYNSSANYTKKTFSRLPNVASPKELGQFENFSDNATVLWKDGKNREDVYIQEKNSLNGNMEWRLVGRYENAQWGVSKFQLNDIVKYVNKDPTTGSVNLSDAPVLRKNEYKFDAAGELLINYPEYQPTGVVQDRDEFINRIDATTVLTQKTVGGQIVTQKTLQAQDSLTANVSVEGKSQTFRQELGAGGKYSSSGAGINR